MTMLDSDPDDSIGRRLAAERKERFIGHYDEAQRFYWRDEDVPDRKVQRLWKKFDKANVGWGKDALAKYGYGDGHWSTVGGLASWLRENYKKMEQTDPNFRFSQNVLGFCARRLIHTRRPEGDNDPHHNPLLNDLRIGRMGAKGAGRKCKCCKKRLASLCDQCAKDQCAKITIPLKHVGSETRLPRQNEGIQ